jgi:hypothetical protein
MRTWQKPEITTFGTPTLTWSESSNAFSFDWGVQFSLKEPPRQPGYIIQQIDASVTIEGGNYPDQVRFPRTQWEAHTKFKAESTFPWQDYWETDDKTRKLNKIERAFDTSTHDSYMGYAVPGTKGRLTVIGSAWFVPGDPDPKTFPSYQSVGEWIGNQYAPSGWQTAQLYGGTQHNLILEWDLTEPQSDPKSIGWVKATMQLGDKIETLEKWYRWEKK